MTTGSGTVLQTTLTVNGRLPTGSTASFSFTLLVSFCGKEPFLPPTRLDQIYYVTDPQTSYELPASYSSCGLSTADSLHQLNIY